MNDDKKHSEELEFTQAIKEYKRKNRTAFPSDGETLGVLRELGWRKLSPEQIEFLKLHEQQQ